MGKDSNIEWCHHTFNPWIGCTKISDACNNCYAEEWANRYKRCDWGGDRVGTKSWGQPKRWNRQAGQAGTRSRVFCASLADVFDNHKSILPEWRQRKWETIKETPHLDWLLVTKRPQNITRFLPEDWGDGYPNVWIGVTAENQTELNRRLPILLSVPAKVHFLSCEPLLEDINLRKALEASIDNQVGPKELGLNWVICGGESAHKKVRRDLNPDWARSLRDQCEEETIPFLFKQWSGANQKEIKLKGRAIDGVMWDGYPTVETKNYDDVMLEDRIYG